MSREEFQQMCNNLSSEEVIWLFIQKCCFKITLDVKGFFVLFGNYFKSHGLHKPVAYLSISKTLMRFNIKVKTFHWKEQLWTNDQTVEGKIVHALYKNTSLGVADETALFDIHYSLLNIFCSCFWPDHFVEEWLINAKLFPGFEKKICNASNPKK